MVVVAQNHLYQIDVGHWLQLHLDLPYPAVAVLVERESVQILVYFNSAMVSGKQLLRLIEGARELRRVVERRVYCLSGVSCDVVVGGVFVDTHTLYPVGSVDVVPCKNVPKTEIVFGLDVVADD